MASTPYSRETTEKLIHVTKHFVEACHVNKCCPTCGRYTFSHSAPPSHCLLGDAEEVLLQCEAEGKSNPLRDGLILASARFAEMASAMGAEQTELDTAAKAALRPILNLLLKSLDATIAPEDLEPAIQ
jgi:hypothetical protein